MTELFRFESYNADATLKQTLSFDFARTMLDSTHENREKLMGVAKITI